MLCMPSFADGGKEGHRMNQSISEILQEIKSLNDITLKGEIVIFGSDYMADFPFYELINHYQIENAVYNRSIAGLTLADAAQALQALGFVASREALRTTAAVPDKYFSSPSIMESYEWQLQLESFKKPGTMKEMEL